MTDIGTVPPLDGCAPRLNWLASQLIPAVRAANADLRTRRPGYEPSSEPAGTAAWYCENATVLGVLAHYDRMLLRRVNSPRPPAWTNGLGSRIDALAAFTSDAAHLFTLFANTHWLQRWWTVLSENESSTVAQSVYAHAAKGRRPLGSLTAQQQRTVNACNAGVIRLTQQAMHLNVGNSASERLRCELELILSGAGFDEAVQAAELLTGAAAGAAREPGTMTA